MRLKRLNGFPKPQWRWTLWIIPLAFLVVFFYAPLGNLLRAVMLRSSSSTEILYSAAQVLRPLSFTFFQASASTLLTLVIGIPTAYLFSHFHFRAKKFLGLLTTLPFILPTVVVAASFNSLFGSNGWINIIFNRLMPQASISVKISGTLSAILLAHVFYNTTIVIRVVGSAWAQLDPKAAQAAQVLGANKWQAFWHITIPKLAPALLSATLLVFLFDFTSFGVILLLGNPAKTTLEVEIYTQAMHLFNLPLASLLALIQLFFTVIIMSLISRFADRWSVGLIPRIAGENITAPRTRGQRWFVRIHCLILGVLFLVPLIALVSQSFFHLSPHAGTYSISLSNYLALFRNEKNSLFFIPPVQAISNSLLFSCITVLISLTVAMLAVFAVNANQGIGKWLQTLFFLPLGTSSVVLGLGLIITYSRTSLPPLLLILLIPLSHSLIAFPFIFRILQPALKAIPDELRQAASSLGASPLKVWKEIELPILLRTLGVGAVFAFTISLGEFGATSFLTRPEVPTIPIAISRFLSQPGATQYGQALAMSSILLLICMVSLSIIDRSQ